ncbi:YraN family protein [Ammoniphilus oxalaticus]|uniref:UPF0102 protein BEP19_07200 n=1 Tax=Ammoniphilus oxalaticus TaxID=66863 RepID=A0A419SJN5_9BACL|nr:YraN family protein [Ammoniphilus oxalaticus]RKD24185.1 YraN family protein [Ammoniphilus oxalaticus]
MESLSSYELGQWGEEVATRFLEQRGYEIIQRNARLLRREVDIIAKQSGTIVFVEVKTRASLRYGSGLEAVDRRKQNRLIQAAKAYLGQGDTIRFDVISILMDPASKQARQIRHIRNAFTC